MTAVLVPGVPEEAPSPDTLLSAAGLHTLLYTSMPPAPGIAAHTHITPTVRDQRRDISCL